MTPPTHAALAYVLYRALRRRPSLREIALIAGFALLPDVVDKTMHYGFGWFSSGRTMLHNVFVLAAVTGLWRVCRSNIALLACIGIASHIVADFVSSLVRSLYLDFSDIPDWWTFLLFPLYDPQLGQKWFLIWTDYVLEGPILLLAAVCLRRDLRTMAADADGKSGL